jgi:uncharacterized protein (DUF58 family)
MPVVVRRRAWLCQEGWYYAAVLAFIVGGAVLRSVNLLVVLAGILIAPLLLNWRLVMASLRQIDVRRRLPASAIAGEPLRIEFDVVNRRRWLGSWLLAIEDRLEATTSGRQGERPLVAKAILAHLAPQEKTTAAYELFIPCRGVYRLGPIRVSTRFPLGLVQGWFTLRDFDELVVAPQLGKLSPEWTRTLEAQHAGDEQRRANRGINEGDYYSLRPYQSGDSRRWIHWRTTAKLNVPMVRQFEREQSYDTIVVIDPWLPNEPDDAERGRLELALSFVASILADFCRRGPSQLTIGVAGKPPQVWSGPSSARFQAEVLRQLARVTGRCDSDLSAALRETLDGQPADARPLVVSTRSQAAALGSGLVAGIDIESLRWFDVSDAALSELFVLD